MSPEKIAIAVAVTSIATAGMGAMKNVTGTSSAVAIVAVSPGIAPTNSPYSAATTIGTSVPALKTRPNAVTSASIRTRSPSAGPTAAARAAACRTRTR